MERIEKKCTYGLDNDDRQNGTERRERKGKVNWSTLHSSSRDCSVNQQGERTRSTTTTTTNRKRVKAGSKRVRGVGGQVTDRPACHYAWICDKINSSCHARLFQYRHWQPPLFQVKVNRPAAFPHTLLHTFCYCCIDIGRQIQCDPANAALQLTAVQASLFAMLRSGIHITR